MKIQALEHINGRIYLYINNTYLYGLVKTTDLYIGVYDKKRNIHWFYSDYSPVYWTMPSKLNKYYLAAKSLYETT